MVPLRRVTGRRRIRGRSARATIPIDVASPCGLPESGTRNGRVPIREAAAGTRTPHRPARGPFCVAVSSPRLPPAQIAERPPPAPKVELRTPPIGQPAIPGVRESADARQHLGFGYVEEDGAVAGVEYVLHGVETNGRVTQSLGLSILDCGAECVTTQIEPKPKKRVRPDEAEYKCQTQTYGKPRTQPGRRGPASRPRIGADYEERDQAPRPQRQATEPAQKQLQDFVAPREAGSPRGAAQEPDRDDVAGDEEEKPRPEGRDHSIAGYSLWAASTSFRWASMIFSAMWAGTSS
jgi:hypothetical protein